MFLRSWIYGGVPTRRPPLSPHNLPHRRRTRITDTREIETDITIPQQRSNVSRPSFRSCSVNRLCSPTNPRAYVARRRLTRRQLPGRTILIKITRCIHCRQRPRPFSDKACVHVYTGLIRAKTHWIITTTTLKRDSSRRYAYYRADDTYRFTSS